MQFHHARLGRTLLAFATMGLLGGCGAADRTDPADIVGSWRLESFGAPTGLTPTASGVETTLRLADGRATGRGGVNSYSAGYETPEPGEIRFGAVMSTRMAGPRPAMEQEAAFFDVLDRAREFEVHDGKLVLAGSNHDTLAVLAPPQ